jgi:hypothetical protein
MSRVQDSATVERGPFEMIPHWLLDAEVSSHAMRLYLILRRHGNAHHVCFPGRKRLAQQMNASTSTIDRARLELVSVGAICYRVRVSDDGDYTSNEYHVHWHQALKCGFYSDEGSPAGDDTSPAGDETGIFTGDDLTNTHSEPRQTNYPERFEAFWREYPRREAKGRALKAWTKAVKTTNQQLIINAARDYAKSYTGDYQFIPLPATWLNDQAWLNETPKTKQAGPVTVMDLYADEPCEHGDPLGEARCPLCRRK